MMARLSAIPGRNAPTSGRPRPPIGAWVLIGVPALLVVLFVWQVASSMLRTEVVVRGAVAISRVSLEPDPQGARVDLVIVDRFGAETTMAGDVAVQVREPDGGMWQASRTVSSGDFKTLPTGGLLAGRLGYSVVVPASDWMRAPRRGGAATVSVSVQPTAGAAFSTMAEERFP